MKDTINSFTRRTALKAGALLAGTTLLNFKNAEAFPLSLAKTPALTADEIAAIEAAIGKKGSYKEAEATYTIPLTTQ